MADLNIDLDGVEAAAPPGEVVPPDTYKAEVVKSDYEETKKGGMMLTLEWLIIEGNYKNRRIWDNLNLVNANAEAQTIARQNLKAVGAAIGLASVPKSEMLHNKPIMIKVAVKPGTNGYPAKNEVKGYTKVTGATAGGYASSARMAPAAPSAEAPSADPASAPIPAPAAAKTMPWKRPS